MPPTTSMDADEVINLFDSCWFQKTSFQKRTPEEAITAFVLPNPQSPLTHRRSRSEDLSSHENPESDSDRPKLQTIFSGKEAQEGEEAPASSVPVARKKRAHKREKKGSKSKSMTELEFEELKGITDLGFVFSDEEKDSRLLSIVPGLQRLGKTEEKGGEAPTRVDDESVCRPYLSDAWAELERKQREKPLMNWRIPALANEMDMKDNLRWWAHTVASAVR